MKKLIQYIIFFLFTVLIFPQCSNIGWGINHGKDYSATNKNDTTITEEDPVIPTEDPVIPTEENPNLDDIISSSPGDRPVSQTSGVAPLAVHFFSDFVDSASGEERINRYHHYDYIWNFDDSGSGTWGPDDKSKNMTKGANAVHIFEEPGDYNVTLTIRNHSGVIDTENYTISVTDPDSFYSGSYTICINNAGDTDFSEAPSGARLFTTDNLSTITQYAVAGCRILFKRGCSWSTSGLTWPNNVGPVTIGAYGTGTNPDAQGIYDNAPRIIVTNGNFLNMSNKQNWRIMDLHLINTSRNTTAIGGVVNIQRQLFLRLKIDGFAHAFLWDHYNDATLMTKDDIVIASCNMSDSETEIIYGGSERLALLGNILIDNHGSHLVRIWQAYRSVISHNIIAGSQITTTGGAHALKFHGPGIGGDSVPTIGEPAAGTGLMSVRTEYNIIADNILGKASGPWAVAIGPQNTMADERLSNIIIERNLFQSDYGTQSPTLVVVPLFVWARYCSIRNNIFDGTGSANDYIAIGVEQRGAEPAPTGIEVYHNTIYRGDSASGDHRGIMFRDEVTDSIARNNLISFPYATGTPVMILDETSDLVSSNNLLTNTPYFTHPDDSNPLDRDFTLLSGSPALGQGISVPVYDDYNYGTVNAYDRPENVPDLGAFEE